MAKHPLNSRRDAMCAWLTANGINPNNVPEDGDLTIVTHPDGTRIIAYEEYDRDAEGRIQVDERGTSAARIKRTTPLLVDPPEWWEPHVKPTRDDLLATLGRVRAAADTEPPLEKFMGDEPTDYARGWAAAMAHVEAALDGQQQTTPKEQS